MPPFNLSLKRQRGKNRSRPSMRNSTARYLRVTYALLDQILQRIVLPQRYQLQIRHAGKTRPSNGVEQQDQAADRAIRLPLPGGMMIISL